METYRELPASVQTVIDGPLEKKVDWVLADTWVQTPIATVAFQWMAYLYRSGPVIRPPCMQIVAEGGMGKTALLLAFAALYPVHKSSDDPLRLQRPVLYVQCRADGVGNVRRSSSRIKCCFAGPMKGFSG